MRQILLMIVMVAMLGCAEKKPVQPSTSNPEATKPELSKAKATAGIKLWEFETGSYVECPAIGSDGTVYVGSHDEKIYALDGKTGTKKWDFETGGWVTSFPAIGSDGTVYIGSVDKLYAIKTDSNGIAKSPWPMFEQYAQRTGHVK